MSAIDTGFNSAYDLQMMMNTNSLSLGLNPLATPLTDKPLDTDLQPAGKSVSAFKNSALSTGAPLFNQDSFSAGAITASGAGTAAVANESAVLTEPTSSVSPMTAEEPAYDVITADSESSFTTSAYSNTASWSPLYGSGNLGFSSTNSLLSSNSGFLANTASKSSFSLNTGTTYFTSPTLASTALSGNTYDPFNFNLGLPSFNNYWSSPSLLNLDLSLSLSLYTPLTFSTLSPSSTEETTKATKEVEKKNKSREQKASRETFVQQLKDAAIDNESLAIIVKAYDNAGPTRQESFIHEITTTIFTKEITERREKIMDICRRYSLNSIISNMEKGKGEVVDARAVIG